MKIRLTLSLFMCALTLMACQKRTGPVTPMSAEAPTTNQCQVTLSITGMM